MLIFDSIPTITGESAKEQETKVEDIKVVVPTPQEPPECTIVTTPVTSATFHCSIDLQKSGK